MWQLRQQNKASGPQKEQTSLQKQYRSLGHEDIRRRMALGLFYRLYKALLDGNIRDTAGSRVGTEGGGGCWNPGDKGGILRAYMK